MLSVWRHVELVLWHAAQLEVGVLVLELALELVLLLLQFEAWMHL